MHILESFIGEKIDLHVDGVESAPDITPIFHNNDILHAFIKRNDDGVLTIDLEYENQELVFSWRGDHKQIPDPDITQSVQTGILFTLKSAPTKLDHMGDNLFYFIDIFFYTSGSQLSVAFFWDKGTSPIHEGSGHTHIHPH